MSCLYATMAGEDGRVCGAKKTAAELCGHRGCFNWFLEGRLVLVDADAELRHLDLQASADVTALLAGAVAELGHAGEGALGELNLVKGVVVAAAAAAAVADSLWRKHRYYSELLLPQGLEENLVRLSSPCRGSLLFSRAGKDRFLGLSGQTGSGLEGENARLGGVLAW